jgi:DNA-binding CsgD family transcriptional regulator
MLVVSQTRAQKSVTLDSNRMARAIEAMGTGGYGRACFAVFEQSLDADHCAVFVHRANRSVDCIASASRENVAAAADAVKSFVSHCHSLDPSLTAVTRRLPQPACMVSMGIADIADAQYRRCFEITSVQERLSLYAGYGGGILQLSIYRGARRSAFSWVEMDRFRNLAGLMMHTASKHDRLSNGNGRLPPMDLAAIESLLERHPARLSKREREVCSRAAVGKTIEGTALDLDVKRTSVITYRQRAYQKLGISCQNELMALVNNFGPN